MINSSKNAKQHANYLHHSTGRGRRGREGFSWRVTNILGAPAAMHYGDGPSDTPSASATARMPVRGSR